MLCLANLQLAINEYYGQHINNEYISDLYRYIASGLQSGQKLAREEI